MSSTQLVTTSSTIDDGVVHFTGDPGNWPEALSSRTWDVVICFGVIHHLSDIQGFLNDIAARTRYGALSRPSPWMMI